MADRGDTHYHVPHLNLWFLVSAVLFLGTTVWTVIDDWNAEWKHYQREFRALDLAKTQAEFDALQAEKAETESGLLAAVEEARARLEAKRAEVDAAQTAAYEAKEDRFKVEEAYKKSKSVFNWEVFKAEQRVVHGRIGGADPQTAMASMLEPHRAAMVGLELEFQEADLAYQAAKRRHEDLRAELTEAEAAHAAATRDLERLHKKIELLDPSKLAEKAANAVRDFPGLDFIGPNLRVQKYVLDKLTFELNFTKKTRIDMCTTCHQGIDSAGFTEESLEPHLEELGLEHAQPFSAHPRLDLYLSSASAHPAKEFGCSICHRGSGEALSFQHVDHRPADAAQAEEWHEEYHWHKQHHWDYPMLRSQNIEASCVQCHKTSMELIAADAPVVTEGYRLFEQKGCYACHKVDWFPVSRKPGPKLANLAAKLEPEFVNAWIARPRAFRPTTHMPQIFHLENFPEDEVVTRSNYDTGEREIRGREWNDNAVAAVTAFLFAKHPKQELPAVPGGLEGDPARGREVMNLRGCFACHDTAPWDTDSYDGVPALSNRVTAHNEMGPNLRGVATKVNLTWLYNWLKDPSLYWPDTRMPDMGLTDQDALDVATYVMEDPDGIFHDTPPGWKADAGYALVFDLAVLQEQARTFYQKEGRHALEEKLAGEWSSVEVLSVKVGEAFVKHQGCFSCHEIAGMETMMPIGTELSNWGSKTVDKLDFGLAYLKPVGGRPQLDHHYREGWLERKLLHPRSYDIEKVKLPKDKLRMPWFDFSPEEVASLSTFMLGLVDDEVQRLRMNPTPEQRSMDAGLRAVRQNNCMACHVIEPGTVTYAGEDGQPITVRGEIQPLFTGDDDPSAPPDPGVYLKLPPTMESLAAFHAEREQAERYLREVQDDDEIAVEEVIVQLWGPNPGAGQDAGAPADKVTIPLASLLDVTPPTGGSFVRHVAEYYAYGTFVENPDYDPSDEEQSRFWRATVGFDEDSGLNLVEDVDGQQRPYGPEEYTKIRWTFAPPVLVDEGHKLQADWFYAFLTDPIPLRRQVRVKMPRFRYDEGEAEAIADYFAAKARHDWYPRYARTLRLALGREPLAELESGPAAGHWDLPSDVASWPKSSFLAKGGGLSIDELAARMSGDANELEPATLAAIEAGSRAAIDANFHKLLAWGTEQGFRMVGPVKEGHELVHRRTPSHLDERAPFIEVGERFTTAGPNCFQCHPNGDKLPETPIAWAPSLQNVRSRIREDWAYEWLWNPGVVYPGTAMPANFSALVPQWGEQYEADGEQQVQAVLDYLYNMDRPRTK